MILSQQRFVGLSLPILALVAFSLPSVTVEPVLAQGKKQPALIPPEVLLKEVKAPKGLEVTIFANHPEVSYPTCLACAPNGDLFVGVDQNGSLDTKPGRGKILRLTDPKGTGKAEQVTVFAEVDSPRGLVYENNTLYVLHPPNLTAYYDDKGTGKSGRSEDLVKGIGNDLNFRGADHTTNGIRMGIDGWIYVAVGDYGIKKATTKDGKEFTMRGGGVVRVRPDGTELEVVARGTRNIYDVAIDPLMNIFTRDNTNDGDGWDVRLSHITPLGHLGYPSLFLRFGDEIIQPLADYGGGAPTGALFLDEPGFPTDVGRSLLTCDWGRNTVYRHPRKANGASFTVEQLPFVELTRPTGIAVDSDSHLYIASWKGATYTFAGPNVGYIIRVTDPTAKIDPFPDLAKAGEPELLKYLASNGHTRRLHAQQEILRRGVKPAFVSGLEKLAQGKNPLEIRVAAIFTLEQLLGAKSRSFLIDLAKDDAVREFSLRALADRRAEAATLPLDLFQRSLTDADPRVRLQAVIGLARIGKRESAKGLIARTGDADPVIAHTAVQALVSLKATAECLAELDRPGTPHALACVRVLQSFHEKETVDGLLERFKKAQSENMSAALFRGLCRLYFLEADWDGKWWSTRPDTSGPYYKPVKWAESDRIGEVLNSTLASADKKALVSVLFELVRHKIDIPGINQKLTALAKEDPAFRPAAAEMLIVKGKIPQDAISLVEEVARSPKVDPAVRAKLLHVLWRGTGTGKGGGNNAGLEATLRGMADLGDPDQLPPALYEEWREYTADFGHAKNVALFVKAADADNAGQRVLAYQVLINLAGYNNASKKLKETVRGVVEGALAKPDRALAILKVIARTRADEYGPQIEAVLKSEHADVRRVAADTFALLGLDRPRAERKDIVKTLDYDTAVAKAMQMKADAELGSRLFVKQNCISCHTVVKNEPVKGPFLGDVAARYKRPELLESILKPSAKIAQGFETHIFTMADGKILTGFIVREGGDEIEIRDTGSQSIVLKKADIDERRQSQQSVMPEGLADGLTVYELASIVEYLEALNRKK